MSSIQETIYHNPKEFKSKSLIAELTSANNITPRPKPLPSPKMLCSDVSETDNLCKMFKKRHVRIVSGVTLSLNIWWSIQRLGRLLPIVKGFKSLQSLTIKASTVGDECIADFPSTLLRIRSILSVSELKIEISSNMGFSDYGINTLCSYLKQFSCLKILRFYFFQCYDITQESMKFISSHLKNLPSLMVFDIAVLAADEQENIPIFRTEEKNGYSISIMTDNTIMDLCFGIKPMQSLHTLQISFPDSNDITDTSLAHLSVLLEEFLSLSQLKLEFSNFENITDDSLVFLYFAVKHLTSLTALDLRFAGCYNISDKGLSYLASICKHLTSLTTLILRFVDCSATDKGIISLASSLERLIGLSTLDLDFSCCDKITSTGVESLSNSLKHLLSLSTLKLNFSGSNNFTDQGFMTLSSSLKCLTSLHKVDLNFQSSQISGNMINNIFSSLSPSVQVLSLNLSSCCKVSGKDIERMFSSLQHCTALTAIALNFSFCSEITNKLVQKMSSRLKRLNTLLRLSLNFTSCRNLTDEGVVHIFSNVKHLSSLFYLNLNFSNCLGITERSLREMRPNIEGLPWIKEIKLSFVECLNINYLKGIVQGFRELSSRATLYLKFADIYFLIKHQNIYQQSDRLLILFP